MKTAAENFNAALTLRKHYDELVALLNRMDEGEAKERIRGRAEEAMQAMRGMPDDMITTGELHTAYRCVVDNGPAKAKRVGASIQSSDVRAGNALRQLEEAGLVTTDDAGTWIPTSTNLTPEEANGIFDAKFPGLTTINKTKPTNTKSSAQRAQPNKEAAMAAKADTNVEFTRDNSKVTGTKFEQVVKMIKVLKDSDTPVGFNDLCEKVGAKYPQDVQAAMFALETIGAIDRYKFVKDGSTRELIAYAWASGEEGGDTPRPTKSTSTASRSRSRGSKKAEAPKTEDKQEEVAAA